jgi:hypothetical protein
LYSALRVAAKAAAIIAVASAVARYLAVDIAGVVTNDSLGYLQRSNSPFGEGFVTEGYRQVAYPLSMWFSNLIGSVLGWDHIFGMALAQRALLAGSIGATVWAMRWWSAPIVLLVTSSTFAAHSNYLLPEGLLIPLCLTLAALSSAIVLGRVGSRGSARVVFAMACIAAAYAAAIKLQYAALIALCAAAAWTLYKDALITRRLALAGLGSVAGFVMILAGIQSIENRHEYGVLEPVSERSLGEWYGAWQAIFTAHEERREDPSLAEWYDGGNLYTAFGEISARYPDYRDRREHLRERVDEMFAAAHTTRRDEHIASFLGALQGGRNDDLARSMDRVLAADPGNVRVLASENRYGWNHNVDEMIRELNGGLEPGFVSFRPLFDGTQRWADDHRASRAIVATVSLFVMIIGVALPGRHRAFVVGWTVGLSSIAIALASGFIDSARFMLGPMTITITCALLVIYRLTEFGKRRLSSATIREHPGPSREEASD